MIGRFGVKLIYFRSVQTMFIPYFRLLRLTLPALLLSVSAHAEVYKWVDDSGQTHYSQSAPENKPTKIIAVPAPPPMEQQRAQQRMNELIQQQENQEATQEIIQREQTQAAQRQTDINENCKRLRTNLETYQNNPGRRMMDADGRVIRLREEDRQQNIQDLQQQIQRYCQ